MLKKKGIKIIMILYVFVFGLIISPHITEKVFADTCGYIDNAVTDNYQINDWLKYQNTIRMGTSDYYITVYGESASGHEFFVNTIQVWGNNGTINNTIIDSLAFDDSYYAVGNKIIYFQDNIYIIINQMGIWSLKAYSTNGSIDDSYIDQENLHNESNNYLCTDFVIANDNILVAVYRDYTLKYGYLETWLINPDGTFSSTKDWIIFNGTTGFTDIFLIDTNTIGIAYSDSSNDGWIKTYEISTDGDIGGPTDAYEDVWEFNNTYAEYPTVFKTYTNKYIVGFQNSTGALIASSFSIGGDGTIIKTLIDNITISSSGYYPFFFQIGDDLLGVSYVGSGIDGFVISFNYYYSTNTFGDTIIDTLEFVNNDIYYYPCTIYMQDYFFVTFYEETMAPSSYIFRYLKVCTYEIECATGGTGEYGHIYINCYDETNFTAINFNITFLKNDLSEWYEETNVTNTWDVSLEVLPKGENIYMIVNSPGYHERTFMLDIYDEYFYFEGVQYFTAEFDIYLPPETSRLYTIQVIDDYNNPLNDVQVKITRYINSTIGTIGISTQYTSGYGITQVYLIAGYPYNFNFTKNGYTSISSTWIPPDADNVTYTVRMTMTAAGQEIVFDNITFDIQPIQRDFYDNFTMYFNISSSDNQLSYFIMNVTFYNETTTLWDPLYYYQVNTTTGGSLSYTTINGVGKYKLICSFKKINNSEYFFGERIYHIWETIPINTNISEDIDDILTNSLGPSPVYVGATVVAYSSLIGAVVVTFLLFTFSPKYAGFGISVVGIMLGVLKAPFIAIIGDVISWTAVVIIIILGVLMTLAYKKDR